MLELCTHVSIKSRVLCGSYVNTCGAIWRKKLKLNKEDMKISSW